jgi:hypothetical protein
MAILSSTRGNPQASDIAVQTALGFTGSSSREDGQTVLNTIDADLARANADKNFTLAQGGSITYNGTAVTFAEDLKLFINSTTSGSVVTKTSFGSRRNWSETGTVFSTPTTTTTAGDLPLGGLTDTAIQLVASGNGAEASHYNSYSFTTPASLSGKMKVEFYQRPGTGFAESEWTVSVYQSTTRQSLSTDSSGVTYLVNASNKRTVYVDF